MCVSLVCNTEEHMADAVHDNLRSLDGCSGLEQLPFDVEKLEGFRYRCEGALAKVTRAALRAARTREVQAALLRSEQLAEHFESNPGTDLQGSVGSTSEAVAC